MAAMLAGVASFSFMDAGLKLLTAHYPSMQVAALRGLAALPVVFAWAMYAGGPRQLLSVRWPLHLMRGVMSVFMMVTFAFALKELSLAKTYALFFVAPLLIAILSIFMLGERVNRTQWVAIAVGFAGVLFVLRPKPRVRLAGTLAVLGTALCYALSSVLVKIIGRTDSTQSMVFWMTCMLAIGATADLRLPGWQAIHARALPDHRRNRDHRRHRAMGHHRGVQARARGERGAARVFGHGLGDPDRLLCLVGDARVADAGWAPP